MARRSLQQAAHFFVGKSVKSSYEIEGLAGQHDYTSFGKEHAGMEAASQGVLASRPAEPAYEGPEYHDNVSVAELPEFAPGFKHAYQELERIGRELLKAIAYTRFRQ